MPTPVATLIDAATIMSNGFVTVGWVIASVAIFVALGIGMKLAPKLLRIVRGSIGR